MKRRTIIDFVPANEFRNARNWAIGLGVILVITIIAMLAMINEINATIHQ